VVNRESIKKANVMKLILYSTLPCL